MFTTLLPMVQALQQYPFLWGIIAGGFFEVARRSSGVIYEAFIDCFYLTASISQDDPAHSWVIYYLVYHTMPLDKHPSLLTDLMEAVSPSGRTPARRIQFSSTQPWSTLDDDDDGDFFWWSPKPTTGGKTDTPIYVHPSLVDKQCLAYQGKTLSFLVKEKRPGDGILTISTVGRDRTIFTQFIRDARQAFLDTGACRLAIYEPRTHPTSWGSEWKLGTSRLHRPLDSVFLPDGIKEDLLADVQEFIQEKSFYRDRGVPYRRGWLLHGVPGSGKTSLLSAIASELKLDIYFINLGGNSIDDNRLLNLFRSAPKTCIVVLEDIDVAQTKHRKRRSGIKHRSAASSSDSDSSKISGKKNDKEHEDRQKKEDEAKNGVTLSGLLNAIDGIASSEGRLLFCTTNHLEHLDPALIRPGRCDVKVEFQNATASQARQLFKHFYAKATPKAKLPADFDTYPEVEKMIIEFPISTPTLGEQKLAEDEEVDELAATFSQQLPNGEVSVSAIQGFLMRHKREPRKAVEDLKRWVDSGYDQAPATTLRSNADNERATTSATANGQIERKEKIACDSDLSEDE